MSGKQCFLWGVVSKLFIHGWKELFVLSEHWGHMVICYCVYFFVKTEEILRFMLNRHPDLFWTAFQYCFTRKIKRKKKTI